MGDWADGGSGGSYGVDTVVCEGADAHVDVLMGAGAAGGLFAIGVGEALETGW